MRKTYEFVSTDMDELDRLLVAGYEQFFGKTVMPGSPERLFISWVEDAIMYERAQNNWTGCQNLPSSAEGEYLDGLAELFYLQERPKPTAATCTMRFYISRAPPDGGADSGRTRVTETMQPVLGNLRRRVRSHRRNIHGCSGDLPDRGHGWQ